MAKNRKSCSMAPRKKSSRPARRSRRIRKLPPCSSCMFPGSGNRKKCAGTKCPTCSGSGKITKQKAQANVARKKGGRHKVKSYFPYFYSHVYKKAKSECKDMLPKEIMKLAGACWRALTDHDKEDFKQKFHGNGAETGENIQTGNVNPSNSAPDRSDFKPAPGPETRENIQTGSVNPSSSPPGTSNSNPTPCPNLFRHLVRRPFP